MATTKKQLEEALREIARLGGRQGAIAAEALKG